MFTVNRYSNAGLDCPALECEDRDEARTVVADYIRKLRRAGFPVTTLSKGTQWEVLEPVNCMMIPPQCGTITLECVND